MAHSITPRKARLIRDVIIDTRAEVAEFGVTNFWYSPNWFKYLPMGGGSVIPSDHAKQRTYMRIYDRELDRFLDSLSPEEQIRRIDAVKERRMGLHEYQVYKLRQEVDALADRLDALAHV